MLLLRACPRCRGDLIVGDEEDESALTCLQCGYVGELPLVQLAERAKPGPVPQERAQHVAGVTPYNRPENEPLVVPVGLARLVDGPGQRS